jgi:beta-glucanase (GH16 family)
MMLAAALALMLGGHSQDLGGASTTRTVQIPFDASKWTLEWADEFDQDGAPDPTKWSYEEGFIRNQEKQYYMRDRRENARVENGKLVITALKDGPADRPISSASLITRGKKEFLYGRIEARAKVPTGRGTWPAIWTLGTNIDQVGWPRCGELDILEHVGYDPNGIHTNVHVEAYNHTKGNGRGNRIEHKDPHTEFHVFAVEWTPEKVEFFFNDLRYLVYYKESNDEAVWPFDKPHYLIMNLAIGGAWGGVQGVDESLLPHRFEIDYVRYYKPKS